VRARERLAEDEHVFVDDERDRLAAFEGFAGLGALPEGGAGDQIVVADGREQGDHVLPVVEPRLFAEGDRVAGEVVEGAAGAEFFGDGDEEACRSQKLIRVESGAIWRRSSCQLRQRRVCSSGSLGLVSTNRCRVA
jgi:hypothetical protein